MQTDRATITFASDALSAAGQDHTRILNLLQQLGAQPGMVIIVIVMELCDM